MVNYQGTITEVIDGSTMRIDINIGGGQIENHVIRLRGIQAENIRKQFHRSMRGARGIYQKFLIDEWLYTRSMLVTVEYYIIDLCGRWLCDVIENGTSENLNDYLKNQYMENDNWKTPEQESLIQDWFDGETVTIPGGDVLPLFHRWGQNVYRGYNSSLINRNL